MQNVFVMDPMARKPQSDHVVFLLPLQPQYDEHALAVAT
jgi:hypothetical protein